MFCLISLVSLFFNTSIGEVWEVWELWVECREDPSCEAGALVKLLVECREGSFCEVGALAKRRGSSLPNFPQYLPRS